jgi:hypothetical protein
VRRAAIAKAVSACALLVGVGVGVASVGCTSASRAPRATLSVQGVNDAPEAAHAEPAPKSVDAVAADGRSRAPAPEGREDRLIARTLKKVSDARGLAATRGVPGVTLSREALIARVKAHVAREIPPVAIRQEGLVLQLLGFVPLDFDYEAETFKLLEAQLAGFYEPSDGTMYMAADLDDDNADATLAHELVHALQDQHYDLKPHSKYTPGQSDKAGAFSALAEGDATSAMADVLVGRAAKGKNALDLPEEMFVAQVLGSVSSGPGASAPHIMRTSLVSPYIQGTLFVHALRRSGGWAAVDRAWKDLPTTTEQILHAAKYKTHEAALDVPAPAFASLGEGWKLADEDTYGELGLRLAFEEWTGADEAAEDASAWGGDRGVLVTASEGRAALAIRVRYDGADAGADAHVRKAFASIASGMETTVGRARAGAKDASFVCVERPKLGPLSAMRSGREVVLLVAPTRTDAGSWAAAGDCATAKKWAGEVVATPALR